MRFDSCYRSIGNDPNGARTLRNSPSSPRSSSPHPRTENPARDRENTAGCFVEHEPFSAYWPFDRIARRTSVEPDIGPAVFIDSETGRCLPQDQITERFCINIESLALLAFSRLATDVIFQLSCSDIL